MTIDWQAFHFIRPQWFWALLPLVLLLIANSKLKKQQSGWQSVLAGHLYQHLVTTAGKGQKNSDTSLLAVGWLLAVVALAGPTWERLPQPVYQLNTGKVVVLDMSMSMRATDVTPDRLTRAKFKAIDLVNTITEGETGLIAYAGDAFIISPLTADAQNLTTLLPSLSPEIMPIPGSEPILALESAINLLTKAGYQQGEIFWITDGVETHQVQELVELIEPSTFRLSVLAIGTEEGAPIKQLNGELMKSPGGSIVIPKLSADKLQLLARKGKGRYAPMHPDDSDIRYLTSQTLLDRDANEEQPGQANNFGDKWREMGPYLLLLLLPLAAYSFRRGIIILILVATVLPLSSPPAHADWWQDMWKTADQQGKQAFDNKDFKGAANHFENPMWQGTAHYRSGDYQAALESFSKVDSIESLYNQGNAQAKLGDLQAAIDAYTEVLKRDPEHLDAKANKELLEQQQAQEQQNQQDQEQQDQQEQSQEQSQEQQGEDQQEQNQDQQNQQQDQEQQNNQDADPEQLQQDDEQQQQENQQEQAEQQPNEEQQQQALQQQPQELTDEEKEQMQRMQNLLRKIPDDPAYLLKRKMQLEAQQRRRERLPNQLQRNW